MQPLKQLKVKENFKRDIVGTIPAWSQNEVVS